MARKPMVTRTIVTTEATVLALDVVKGEPQNIKVVMPRTYTDKKKLLEKIKDNYDTEELKCVQVVDTKEVETLYGMSEQDFIKNAIILNPATRKAEEELYEDDVPVEATEA